MRIAIGGVFHETNTFSTVKTTMDLFKVMGMAAQRAYTNLSQGSTQLSGRDD
jgi:microcystin degradation protein MlrC